MSNSKLYRAAAWLGGLMVLQGRPAGQTWEVGKNS